MKNKKKKLEAMTTKQLIIVMVRTATSYNTTQSLHRLCVDQRSNIVFQISAHVPRRALRFISQGVSGSGKSTLGKNVADRLGFPFVDGDDHHPESNIEKMSRGEALDDRDRLPWLGNLREIGIQKLEEEACRRGSDRQEGATGVGEGVGVVLACSSLKGFYRQILRGKLEVRAGGISCEPREVGEAPPTAPRTYFVWIKGDKETLMGRMLKRENHFFKAKMLDSQFDALEPPEDEPDVVVVPLEPPIEEQKKIALEGLRVIARREPVTDSKP